MATKLSSAQIIERGEYLNADFDPSTLTVSQLLGIFGFHNVMYPTSGYTKARLVQLFNDEIKAKAAQFKKERLSRQNSQASDDGIMDGLTGLPLNGGRKPATRSSSRRASAAPKDPAPEPSRPEPAKRRRSSAEPSLGGTTGRRRAAKVPEPVTVAEDSEPEEPVVRKVGKKKASGEAGSQARRAAEVVDVDSGWEDNNIFQSGAESASPSPVKPRTRRGSAIPARSRKSTSVPPQFAPPPSPTKAGGSKIPRKRGSSVKPPESDFQPQLSEDVFRETRAAAARARSTTPAAALARHSPAPKVEETKLEAVVEDVVVVEDEEPITSDVDAKEEEVVLEVEQITETVEVQTEQESPVDGASQEYTDDSQSLVSSQDSSNQAVARRTSRRKSSRASFLQFFLTLLLTGTLTAVYNYKMESAPIGFCETGKDVNPLLQDLRIRRAAVEECNKQNRTTLWALTSPDGTSSVHPPIPTQTPIGTQHDSQLVLSEPCPPLPLLPLPPPNTCAPCPEHGICTPSTVSCETGYLLRPHPLLAFLSPPGAHASALSGQSTYVNPSLAVAPTAGNVSAWELAHTFLSLVLDGVPGMGPVAFPPRCVEDPRRKRHIGALGKALESILATERGRRLCVGVRAEPLEAKKWGVEVEALKETMRKKTKPHLLPTLDDTFNEAIQQLVEWGGVFIEEDEQGHRYIAHRTPKLDALCAVKVKAQDTFAQHWPSLSLFALLSSVIAWVKHNKQVNSADKARAAALIETVYGALRNAELAHHADPVSHPYPAVASERLRDALLQDVPLLADRQRIWRHVEAPVEKNTNVLTSHEEVEGGAEMRSWRWVGSVGKTLPYELTPARDAASP